MPFEKGKSGNPDGRATGTKNKFTTLKEAYLGVFEKIEKEGLKKDGAIKTFYEWVTKNDRNQGVFYQMLSKMLPSNITHDGDVKITHQLSEKFFPKLDEKKK